MRFVWRAIRPHVYSLSDYARLIERQPEELTYGEVKQLKELAEVCE